MKFIKVASTNDLTPGSKIKVTVENRDILLANLQGSYYAMDNTCPHMGGSLVEGDLEGNNIVCPRHGSIFDITTGKVVKSGKLLFISVKVHDLISYPIKIEGSEILIGFE